MWDAVWHVSARKCVGKGACCKGAEGLCPPATSTQPPPCLLGCCLQAGAKGDARDKAGTLPIFMAAARQSRRLVERLLPAAEAQEGVEWTVCCQPGSQACQGLTSFPSAPIARRGWAVARRRWQHARPHHIAARSERPCAPPLLQVDGLLAHAEEKRKAAGLADPSASTSAEQVGQRAPPPPPPPGGREPLTSSCSKGAPPPSPFPLPPSPQTCCPPPVAGD